jgi:hypothetical protein
MKVQELVDDIREMCAVNLEVDWSDKDPREEFLTILNLIQTYNKEDTK